MRRPSLLKLATLTATREAGCLAPGTTRWPAQVETGLPPPGPPESGGGNRIAARHPKAPDP
jgi:hypothetical protein